VPSSVAGLLAEIERIGRDAATGGYQRFAWTREDAALAEWFAAACEARGLPVSSDRCGNQWAWWGDPDAAIAGGAAGVVTGSHLDSVPQGGAFDGPLGLACALVAVDRLRARGFAPTRPIGVVRFVDEEGARFGLACSGSRLVTGASEPERVLALRDAGGTAYADALAAAGGDPRHAGRDDEALRRVGSFVELHVEQGRGLVDLGCPIGVATMIRPHGRWRIELSGRADHAGTTLLADRLDPMLDLARLVQAVREVAERRGALATVGRVEVSPNAVNAIPGHVNAWLDVRAEEEHGVRAVIDDLAAVGFAAVEESWTPATWMDRDLGERVAALVAGLQGGEAPMMATGAGHDAGILAAAGIPAAMLFVRNPTGISHSPSEYAEPADCEAGADALAAVLADLALASPGALSSPAAPPVEPEAP
jgi:N-carbamoyl-L-amino-acid hydrolase